MLTPLETVGIWIGIIIGIPTILYNIYKYRNLLLIPLKWCKVKIANVWELAIGREKLKKRYELKITEMNITHQGRINELEAAHQSEIKNLKTAHQDEIQKNKNRNIDEYYKSFIPDMSQIQHLIPDMSASAIQQILQTIRYPRI